VKCQQVVCGLLESGHRCDASDALVRAMPVVVVNPLIESLGTLVGVLIDKGVGPFPDGRLDEALGLTVGLRPVGLGEAVLEP